MADIFSDMEFPPRCIPTIEDLLPLHYECDDLFLQFLDAEDDSVEEEMLSDEFTERATEFEKRFLTKYQLMETEGVSHKTCREGGYNPTNQLAFKYNKLTFRSPFVAVYNQAQRKEIYRDAEDTTFELFYVGLRGLVVVLKDRTKPDAPPFTYAGMAMFGYCLGQPTESGRNPRQLVSVPIRLSKILDCPIIGQ